MKRWSSVSFWRTLSTRITLLVVVASTLLFVLLAWYTLTTQQEENRNLAEQELRTLNLTTQATLNRIMRYGFPELVQEVIAELEVHRRVRRALIFDHERQVLFSNFSSEKGQPVTNLNLHVPDLFQTPAEKYSTVKYYPELHRFYAKVPLTGQVDEAQVLQRLTLMIVYDHDGGLTHAVTQRKWTLLWQLLVILTTASLLRVYLHYRLTRPMARLRQGIEQLRDTHSRVIVPLDSADELGEMARAIEKIATDRARSIRDLKNLTTAIEQSNECVVITNTDGLIEYVNEAFSHVSGYSKTELIGQNLRILQSGSTSSYTYRQLWDTLLSGKTWRGELLNKRKDGTTYLVWATITPVLNEHNEITHFIGVEDDITERKAAEEKLHFLAYYEPLTALPNRFHLNELMQQVLIGHPHDQFGALLLIDMDRLQHINDARGYKFGSQLIKLFAQRLKNELKQHEHTLAHLGADTFAVLLPDDSDTVNDAKRRAAEVGQLLLNTAKDAFYVAGEEVNISASGGAVIYPEAGDEALSSEVAERIIRAAETALHKAKQNGGNGFAFYKSRYSQQAQRQFDIAKRLRRALAENELKLYVQPQVNRDGQTVSAEALIRWQDPEHGMISPGTFIPVAEQSELIVAIDRWVLTQVCNLLSSLKQRSSPLTIAVNISARHFRQSDFEDWIDALLSEHQVAPDKLVLEVTESLLLDDLSDVISKIENLTKLGVQFSIDDFGTGYSSLSYISRLPVHELKIDQSFVQAIGDRKAGDAVVETIVSVANHMGMRIVAEGVETEQQAAFLRQLDPTIVMQGYLYARPAAVTAWRASLN